MGRHRKEYFTLPPVITTLAGHIEHIDMEINLEVEPQLEIVTPDQKKPMDARPLWQRLTSVEHPVWVPIK